MRPDSRLSRLLHVLIHMSEHAQPMTSETIACILDTNAVVVRRIMAGLREAGYVSSEKGHGGGWTLVRPLADISLLDVYHAIDSPGLFTIGVAREDAHCLVEQAVNAALTRTLQDAERMLLEKLSGISVADVEADYKHRLHGVDRSGEMLFAGCLQA